MSFRDQIQGLTPDPRLAHIDLAESSMRALAAAPTNNSVLDAYYAKTLVLAEAGLYGILKEIVEWDPTVTVEAEHHGSPPALTWTTPDGVKEFRASVNNDGRLVAGVMYIPTPLPPGGVKVLSSAEERIEGITRQKLEQLFARLIQGAGISP